MSLRLACKVFTSPFAATGIMFALFGLGINVMPPEMDPTEKFGAIGVTPGIVMSVISLVVGALKFSVPLNSWILKNQDLAKYQFYIAVPGFGLVFYAHQALGLPLAGDVPVFLFPVLLGVFAFTTDDKGSKSK